MLDYINLKMVIFVQCSTYISILKIYLKWFRRELLYGLDFQKQLILKLPSHSIPPNTSQINKLAIRSEEIFVCINNNELAVILCIKQIKELIEV